MQNEKNIIEKLFSVQGLINPASGFLKRGTPKTRKHIESVRQDLRDVIAKLREQGHGS